MWWSWDIVLRACLARDFPSGGEDNVFSVNISPSTQMPAISSLCLIPWQHIAYLRKLEWRHYLAWISHFCCLIAHTLFHSTSVSFCRNMRLGMANRRGIAMSRLISWTFQGTLTRSSFDAPTSTYHLWAQTSRYSESVWWLMDRHASGMCSRAFLLLSAQEGSCYIFPLRHWLCLHITLIEHLFMKHM